MNEIAAEFSGRFVVLATRNLETPKASLLVSYGKG
jgi:hypothetical protein